LQSLQLFDWSDIVVGSTQNAFDNFYSNSMQLLNTHYPLQTVTLTSRDPPFITPAVKTMLRRKNTLMRRGRTVEYSALALRISTGIAKHNSGRLVDANTIGSKSMWAKVNEVTGKQRRAMPTEGGLDAAVLNAHYAATSTDLMYTVPQIKSTCSNSITWPTERTVFNALHNLKNTASGMDGILHGI